MQHKFETHTLTNGLRLVTVHMPESPSTTVMVMVNVGARHEETPESGISHFIEHNVFKATTNRPIRNQTTEEIEGMGGVTNAGTGHDFTYYYAKSASFQAPQILDVVMDISLNMTFPEQDIEIEKGNVIEEINMYDDNPSQRIYNKFFEFLWEGSPVGRSILGTIDSVSSFNREQMLDYVKRHYVPENMIVTVSGSFDPEKIRSMVEKYYQHLPASGAQSKIRPFAEFQEEKRILLDKFDSKQAHLCLGVKSFGRNDERRFALDTLNSILGRGLSSRLFKRIRDELGLAYYIGSSNYEFEDTGSWVVRAGVDTKRATVAIEAILGELKRVADEKVPDAELRKGKEYVKGKILLGAETSDDLGEWYGFQELQEEAILSPEEYNAKIEAITADDMQKVAQDLLTEQRLNLGLIGPFDSDAPFREVLKI